MNESSKKNTDYRETYEEQNEIVINVLRGRATWKYHAYIQSLTYAHAHTKTNNICLTMRVYACMQSDLIVNFFSSFLERSFPILFVATFGLFVSFVAVAVVFPKQTDEVVCLNVATVYPKFVHFVRAWNSSHIDGMETYLERNLLWLIFIVVGASRAYFVTQISNALQYQYFTAMIAFRLFLTHRNIKYFVHVPLDVLVLDSLIL